jgi:hypothetical protein
LVRKDQGLVVAGPGGTGLVGHALSRYRWGRFFSGIQAQIRADGERRLMRRVGLEGEPRLG